MWDVERGETSEGVLSDCRVALGREREGGQHHHVQEPGQRFGGGNHRILTSGAQVPERGSADVA